LSTLTLLLSESPFFSEPASLALSAAADLPMFYPPEGPHSSGHCVHNFTTTRLTEIKKQQVHPPLLGHAAGMPGSVSRTIVPRKHRFPQHEVIKL
jgi:hypothetical protein